MSCRYKCEGRHKQVSSESRQVKRSSVDAAHKGSVLRETPGHILKAKVQMRWRFYRDLNLPPTDPEP